ncbi:MAG: 4Fe-4S binding protein [Sedimentisphaerales bacterium]|nr:4Fe-4S binding protein [Sedimentisphaerales bacterium]
MIERKRIVSERIVISIDQSKCDGCGLCITACAEQAIELVGGKAVLKADRYCDGLGACVGQCPRGAISLETRQAEAFDPGKAFGQICPGLAELTAEDSSGPLHWPIKLALVRPEARHLDDCELLVAGDCVGYVAPGLAADAFGRRVIIACPKLGDRGLYARNLAAIFANHSLRSISVAYMDLPCCAVLARLVLDALGRAGKDTSVRRLVFGIDGRMVCGHQAGRGDHGCT